MDAKVKADWLAALRSGEYEQGSGYLRNTDNGFCCLGVLCDLAVKAKVIPEPIVDENESVYVYGPDPDAEFPKIFLPDAVIAWSGLDENDPGTTYRGTSMGLPHLSSMNDEGQTFPEIADAIEQYY